MAIKFRLNGQEKNFKGDPDLSLLKYLREIEGIISTKDGCSGQAACGACLLEMNGKPTLSCVTPMKKTAGAEIITLEGLPEELRRTLARSFVEKGAVQCGFCTPGFLMRTKILLKKNPHPTVDEIKKALKFNLCRCTGYLKIIEAIRHAAGALRGKKEIELSPRAGIGSSLPKYDAFQKAIGQSPFVDDLKIENLLHAVLKFSDHPRARVKRIDISAAQKAAGVVRVFTGADIPGERYNGLIVNDWPLLVMAGETTRYVGDVLAGVVAESESAARAAAALIDVDYEVLEPITGMLQAETGPNKVHEKGNLLDTCVITRGGDSGAAILESAHVVTRTFKTQRIEHAFLETETAVALPWEKGGIEVYSQGQGVYEDRRQIARILGLPEEKVKVTQVAAGGGFGGKEDMTVQGHAALFAYRLQKPVKLHLSRPESMVMHPKRHPMVMDYTVGCDERGKLTVVKARICGDTGAYASVGKKVLERAAGHSTGAYHVPTVDVTAKTIYTNNIPGGAMRGFGVNQVTFALESCIDELCEKGGFDRWQFRFDNALAPGSQTAAGQVLHAGVGVRESLLAVKEKFYAAQYAGLACGIKNCGIGNGMADFAEVKIEIVSADHVVLHHGWTEMGQGVHTVALQTLCEETGIDPRVVEVKVCTAYEAKAGMTTASRGTSLVGNAVINAAGALKKDLQEKSLAQLKGKVYPGRWSFDRSTAPGAPGEVITHYSYSYAAQLVVLDETGKIDTVYAAHDAGKIINPVLFESQIQGAVHMGLGYALSEDFPMEQGRPLSTKLRDLGILKIQDTPEIVVLGVEVKDPLGPYGAKGIGEIGLVPTAPAVANALYSFDKVRRTKLPMLRE
ncbi:MAG: selenium-dependent xanthine dehydrogenase [Candidatus Aminicenantes bacterium]|nr:selenium-dependent xanthine dehydrogenase [Candidatus Aminicenantes bacterium]